MRKLKTVSNPTFAVNDKNEVYLTGVVLESAGACDESDLDFYNSLRSEKDFGRFLLQITLKEGISLAATVQAKDFYMVKSPSSVYGVNFNLYRVIMPFLKLSPQECEIFARGGVLHPDNTHPI